MMHKIRTCQSVGRIEDRPPISFAPSEDWVIRNYLKVPGDTGASRSSVLDTFLMLNNG